MDERLLIFNKVNTDRGLCLFDLTAAIRISRLNFGRGFFLVVAFKLGKVVIARAMAAVVVMLVLMSYFEVLLHVDSWLLAVRICNNLLFLICQ